LIPSNILINFTDNSFFKTNGEHMKYLKTILLILLGTSIVFGQIKVKKVDKVQVKAEKAWSAPQFSKDGKTLYLTTANYQGIWEFSLNNKQLKTITLDEGAGYGFDVSSDSRQIAYRRTLNADKPLNRTQEIVLMDLSDNSSSIIEKGNDLSIPVLNNTSVVYSSNNKIKNIASLKSTGIKVLGIENTKIVLNKNGEKLLFDPLGNGSYIWPSLSPDGKKLLAYDMSIGTFICDIDGKNILKLGRKNYPQWTRDGKWIIYMNDKDDGHNVLSSDIFAVSPVTKKTVQLTNTNNIIEMNPSCSPVENKITYNTLSGEIYILSYEEK
jgi:Tol biopolymer transport system component